MKKTKKTIEEQVAELTEQQKETILKIAKYATIAEVITLGCSFSIMGFLFLIFILAPGILSDLAFFAFLATAAFCILFLVALLIVIFKKFPYYSDRKALYLMKQRRQNKKK